MIQRGSFSYLNSIAYRVFLKLLMIIFQMLHRVEVVTLVQTVAEPFIQKSIHHPFLFDHIGDVERTVSARMQLLNFDHARVVTNL